MMTLDQYLKETGQTNEAFARVVGLTPVSVSRIRNGHQRPSYERMVKIEEATRGKVPISAWPVRGEDAA